MSTAGGVSATPLRKAVRHELQAIRGFRGVSWLMVGFALKRLPQMAA